MLLSPLTMALQSWSRPYFLLLLIILFFFFLSSHPISYHLHKSFRDQFASHYTLFWAGPSVHVQHIVLPLDSESFGRVPAYTSSTSFFFFWAGPSIHLQHIVLHPDTQSFGRAPARTASTPIVFPIFSHIPQLFESILQHSL